MQKRADSSQSIWIIISLILGAVILVSLVYGFSTNWEIFNTFFTKSNKGEIQLNCLNACSKGDFGKNEFCVNEFELIVNSKNKVKGTCYTLSKIKTGIFADLIPECPGIICSNNFDEWNEEYFSDPAVYTPSPSLNVVEVPKSNLILSRELFKKMNIDSGTGESMGARLSSALILFQYKESLPITGIPDVATLKRLKEVCSEESCLEYELPTEWKKEPITTPFTGQAKGYLDTSKLVALPVSNPIIGQYAFAEKSTALAWAFMIREILKDDLIKGEVNYFVPLEADCVYRSYLQQVVLYINYYASKNKLEGCEYQPEADIPDWTNSEQANLWLKQNAKNYCNSEKDSDKLKEIISYISPLGKLSGQGSGYHSLGVAIDFAMSDKVSSPNSATTTRLKWLEKNYDKFGFCPYLVSGNKILPDGSFNYAEKWHWRYVASSGCNIS